MGYGESTHIYGKCGLSVVHLVRLHTMLDSLSPSFCVWTEETGLAKENSVVCKSIVYVIAYCLLLQAWSEAHIFIHLNHNHVLGTVSLPHANKAITDILLNAVHSHTRTRCTCVHDFAAGRYPIINCFMSFWVWLIRYMDLIYNHEFIGPRVHCGWFRYPLWCENHLQLTFIGFRIQCMSRTPLTLSISIYPI